MIKVEMSPAQVEYCLASRQPRHSPMSAQPMSGLQPLPSFPRSLVPNLWNRLGKREPHRPAFPRSFVSGNNPPHKDGGSCRCMDYIGPWAPRYQSPQSHWPAPCPLISRDLLPSPGSHPSCPFAQPLPASVPPARCGASLRALMLDGVRHWTQRPISPL